MYDIIIIGSGPAGLTAAIYASRARLQTLVLERDTMGAGQIAVTEQVDNYPGLPHIGGGDTALEDALYLSRMAKTVYLVHRRDTFRANAALQEAVQKTENIVLVTNAVPTEITGEKRVETLKLLQGGSPEELSLDGVFVAIGSVPNTSLLEGVAELDSSGYVQAGEDGRTSVEGLFAAGDVRTKALRQVITAAADGANCVASAEKYLLENRG